MGSNPREFLQRLRETNPQIRNACPEAFDAYVHFHDKALEAGRVDARTKELIAPGASLFARRPYCIPFHVQRAPRMGITPEEMIETGLAVATVGGGSSMTHVSQIVQAIDELRDGETQPDAL